MALIEREMRAMGHAKFSRRILYSRVERGLYKPGWIERFGWRRSADTLVRAPSNFHKWLKRVSHGMTWDWRHQRHIYKYLQAVTSGESKRLMIFLPPRHGKSELVTVRYTAWRMSQDPKMNVILGSYNQRLANRFSRKVRRVLADAAGNADALVRTDVASASGSTHIANGTAGRGARVPARFANSESEWETRDGGGLRAVGVGGGVTGFGADLIVIDDPVKSRAEAESKTFRDNVWEWFNDDIYTRLEPNAAIILIQTRWHEDDLAGRLLKEMSHGGEYWDVLSLPALSEPPASAGGQCEPVQTSHNTASLVGTSMAPAHAGGSDNPSDPLGRQPGEAPAPNATTKKL